MSGNICRCGAYPNIVAAIQQAMARWEASHEQFRIRARQRRRRRRARRSRPIRSAKFIAGGTNLIDLMKDDVERPDAADRHLAAAARRRRGDRRRRPAHRRAGAEHRPRLPPADRAALSAAVERDPGRRLAATAQHGLHRRQPAAAHALLLLLRHGDAVQQARARQRLLGHRAASTASTRSSAPAKPASPRIRPTCASRSRRSTPRST